VDECLNVSAIKTERGVVDLVVFSCCVFILFPFLKICIITGQWLIRGVCPGPTAQWKSAHGPTGQSSAPGPSWSGVWYTMTYLQAARWRTGTSAGMGVPEPLMQGQAVG